MLLTIHSVVDVITNSSTVCYVKAGDTTIKTVKEIINSLLQGFGIVKTADDLFRFDLVYDEDTMDDYRTNRIENEYEEEINKFGDDYKGASEFIDTICAKFEKAPPEWWNNYESVDYGDEDISIYLKVTPKPGFEKFKGIAKAIEKLQDTFNTEACFNG